ncbi:serine hydrolase [Pontibacillus yanchengensis]|uniref:Serine hydrolase n=1 Tax=Pontibacillus yanchengensis TaxID=462910 RepID=A0ACC7VIM2_9BACI|nr:serine hydrolase [Pontibacillus yanchengensis]
MKRKTVSIILSTVLVSSLVTPITGNAANGPTIENHHKKNPHQSSQQAHPNFTWNNPGPSSPVLHPGSIRGSGLRKEPLQDIDTMIRNAIDDQVMPGAVALVARRGQVVKHDAYGYAAKYKNNEFTELEHPQQMEKNTVFDLASISKLFTTTAAMTLYEEGKFELDDPVAKYIPEFATNGKENVTIEQLMTHTSGFKPWIPLYTIEGDREDRLQHVYKQPLQSEPGKEYTYSDLNMITLGALVEEWSGMRLDQYVEKAITKPLGMKETMYNPPSSLKDRIAATEYQPWTDRGLVWGEVHDENAWSLNGVAGHAGVFSTASDLATFAHMFVMDGRYGGERILEPETVDLLTENRIPEFPGDDHGLGWELQQDWFMDGLSESNTLGHTGYTGTSIVVSPTNKTVAILLTNRVHPTRNTVSTSPTRRKFARNVADSIPVSIPNKGEAWFSGYGNNETKHLTAEINVDQNATLTFDTWYRIEPEADVGKIEISSNGTDWTQLDQTFTGTSGDWDSIKVALPKDTSHLRFTYETDYSVNRRGWYIHQPELVTEQGNTTPLHLNSEKWTKRSY